MTLAVLLGLPLLTGLVSACVVGALTWGHTSDGALTWTAAIGVATGLVVAAPAAHWAIDTGRTRLRQWLGIGAAAGSVPMFIALMGYGLGMTLRGGFFQLPLEYSILIQYLLGRVGILGGTRWLGTPGAALIPTLVGAATGAAFSGLVVRRASVARGRPIADPEAAP